ncbi:MAG TPA: pentapeptide repeat-containing protein [Roseiflexaceae bacterium]|nr:pentapeptide repeat-containing protein [Roseiflexaceae bacterium]
MRHKRSIQATITPPQLPDQLAEASQLDPLADQASYARQALLDCDFSSQQADDVLFEQVVCTRVSFNQGQLTLAQLFDARLDSCDLAGAEWSKAHLRRVELGACRLVGLRLSDSSLDEVLITRSNAELARFWSCAFKAARFDHCVLREASFDGSDLSGVVFRDCDLGGADLRNTKLKGADLRGSTLTGVRVGIKELQGAIVTANQAIQLVGLLGVTVREED